MDNLACSQPCSRVRSPAIHPTLTVTGFHALLQHLQILQIVSCCEIRGNWNHLIPSLGLQAVWGSGHLPRFAPRFSVLLLSIIG